MTPTDEFGRFLRLAFTVVLSSLVLLLSVADSFYRLGTSDMCTLGVADVGSETLLLIVSSFRLGLDVKL